MARARCRTAAASCCRPISPRAWRCCARCRRKVQVVAGVDRLAAAGDGKLARSLCRPAASARRIAGRPAAAAPGRGAERQSRDGGRRRASLGRRCSSAGRRCSTRTATPRLPASRWRATAPASAAPTAAAERGRIAALRGGGGAGAGGRCEACRRWRRSRARRCAEAERGRAFLDALYRPAPQFRMPAGDTIVCRCEEVTAKRRPRRRRARLRRARTR